MAEKDLEALFRLHRIDAAMAELKARAQNFDPTRDVRAAIEAFKPAYVQATAALRRLEAELQDGELTAKGIEEKLKKYDKQLYGGQVVNPKEVEAIEHEMKNLRDRKDEVELKELEIMDALPAVRTRAKELEGKLRTLTEQFNEKKDDALNEQARIQATYKELAAKRGDVATGVPAGLLAQYDAIRKKQSGIGMAEVTERGTCGACGTALPTKTVLMAQEYKLVTCDECHRILFQVVPKS